MGQRSPVRSEVGGDAARDIPRAASDTPARVVCAELDCLQALLPDATLAAAARRAAALRTGADRVLVAQGIVGEESYLQRLSVRTGIAMTDFANASRADLDISDDDIRQAAQSGLLRMRVAGRPVLVICLRGDRARRLMRMAATSPRDIGQLRLSTEAALQDFLLDRTDAIIGHAIDGLRDRYPALSAAPHAQGRLRTAMRRAAVWTGLVAIVAAVATFPAAAGNLLAMIFLAAIALRLAASCLAAPAATFHRVPDAELPEYSVIVALYREAPSVRRLLAALAALDYPPEKLDVIIVVETDDLATRAAIARERRFAGLRVVVAPNAGPRTKPKALNVALPFARGRYVAVYDAEDRPDPDQLRKAVAAFRAGDDDLVCVQARLAIDNADDGLLTRMFAAEYAGQFDVAMPGYDRLGLPWPLGGTSNHFRADVLRDMGAWDPFNVTEDADLGLRIARFGYRTATVDSTTWEEAPVGPGPWLRQRTRWMKGWMQTWRVHARYPRRYWRRTGWRGWAARDLMIGGALLAALAYPALLVFGLGMLGEYLVTGETEAAVRFAAPLHLMSIACGLAAAILIPLRGLACRGRLRHAWILALTPFYWVMLSAAAWLALRELRRNPYHWAKTDHGLAKARLSEPNALSMNGTAESPSS